MNLGITRIVGGGERLALAMTQALTEAGHEVTLATVQGVSWEKVRRIFGRPPRVSEKRLSLLPSLIPYTYKIPLSLMRFRRISHQYDLTINSQGETLPARADILYLQGGFMFTIARHSDIYEYWRKSSPSWSYAAYRAYFTPYSWFFDRKIDMAVHNSSVLLANSSYSARIVELETSIQPEVLYPPVDTEMFRCATSAPKENLIITVGRFSPDKNYEFIPRLARLCPEYEFVVVGTVTSRASLEGLRRQVLLYGVSNVNLLVDLGLSELRGLYARAKFYLHTKTSECFGISVVEAMSASCVPIVPKSGGPWWDIIQKGKYGLGYSDESEAAHLIRSLDAPTCKKVRALATARSQSFTYAVFKERLLSTVHGIKSM